MASLEVSRFPHGLITSERDTGNTWYLIANKYPQNMEMVAMRLESDETLKRGGGAKRKHNDKEEMDDATLAKSRQRARRQIRRKCFALSVDSLLTLTFRENLTDLAEAWKIFKAFTRRMHARYGDRWAYVCVPEYQKRGAVHFHLAIAGQFHWNTVRRLWQRAAADFGGNVDFSTSRKRIGKNSYNARRVAQYLSKYIAKSDSVSFNGRRYSTGGTVPEPEKFRGFVALGLNMPTLFREVFNVMVNRHPHEIWESDERPIVWAST